MDRDPWAGLDVNIRGAQNVIEACRANEVKKLVFASSNAVYGYGPGRVGRSRRERRPSTRPARRRRRSFTAPQRSSASSSAATPIAKHGLNYVVLRYSTVYGERQHYRAANALYIIETHDRIKQGERPRVIGDGSETKHFVYVGDLARANAAAFEADATDVAVNVSGPAPVTTLELVTLVTELSGSELDARACGARGRQGAADLGRRLQHRSCGGRERDRLGPEVDMREGIARLIAWRDAAAK